MQILILLPRLSFGGVERVRLILATEFLRMKHDVTIVTLFDSTFCLGIPSGVRHKHLSLVENQSLLRAIVPLIYTFAFIKYDLLLTSMWPLSSLSVLISRLVRPFTPIYSSEHNNLQSQFAHFSSFKQLVLRGTLLLACLLASKNICVSLGVKQCIKSLTRLPDRFFHVIHNPLVLANSSSSARHLQNNYLYQYESQSPVLLNISRLKPQKNHKLLISAFSLLLLRIPNAKLIIVGDGDLRHALEQQILLLGVHKSIQLLGFHENVVPFYQQSSHFVLTSDYEGFGNVLVEALSFGLQVFSRDCPYGPREILADGKYGFLSDSSTSEELSSDLFDFIKRFHIDPSRLRQRASEFTPAFIASEYLRKP